MNEKLYEFEFVNLINVDSTNSYVAAKAAKGEIKNFSCVRADYQSKGRGQGKNTWKSPSNKNLLASLYVEPRFLSPHDQFMISKITALAVKETIEYYTKSSSVRIKWPNDILVFKRKIAGILIENSYLGDQLQYCIIGIGINVNQHTFVKSLQSAASVFLLSGKENTLQRVLNKLISVFSKYYKMLEDGEYEAISNKYLASMFGLNVWKDFEIKGELVRAKVIGVDEYGFLLLQGIDKAIMKFDIKEVSWVF